MKCIIIILLYIIFLDHFFHFIFHGQFLVKIPRVPCTSCPSLHDLLIVLYVCLSCMPFKYLTFDWWGIGAIVEMLLTHFVSLIERLMVIEEWCFHLIARPSVDPHDWSNLYPTLTTTCNLLVKVSYSFQLWPHKEC